MSDDLKTLRREIRAWRRFYGEAWEALALIREAVEEHGGNIVAGERVQPPTLFGEAEAIVRGIDRIAADRRLTREGRRRQQDHLGQFSLPLPRPVPSPPAGSPK